MFRTALNSTLYNYEVEPPESRAQYSSNVAAWFLLGLYRNRQNVYLLSVILALLACPIAMVVSVLIEIERCHQLLKFPCLKNSSLLRA